jgi:ASCH domain
MAVEPVYIELTPANIRYGHIYLGEHVDIFPSDVIGGANKLQAANRKVKVDCGTEVASTDIDRKKGIFRKRAWVRRFFRANHAAAGHRVVLEQLGPHRYRVSMEPTKLVTCLSIQQPWADLIISGKKRVENRSWDWSPFQRRLNSGETVMVGIHVSSGLTSWKKFAKEELADLAPGWSPGDGSTAKTVVGVVDVVRICPPADLEPELKGHKYTDHNQKWCWVLANPRPLSEPFKARGNLKPFNVRIPRRLFEGSL